ncbi:MAG: hypothetical protein R3C03_10140 [Pirellulaceae bacterium]
MLLFLLLVVTVALATWFRLLMAASVRRHGANAKSYGAFLFVSALDPVRTIRLLFTARNQNLDLRVRLEYQESFKSRRRPFGHAGPVAHAAYPIRAFQAFRQAVYESHDAASIRFFEILI